MGTAFFVRAGQIRIISAKRQGRLEPRSDAAASAEAAQSPQNTSQKAASCQQPATDGFATIIADLPQTESCISNCFQVLACAGRWCRSPPHPRPNLSAGRMIGGLISAPSPPAPAIGAGLSPSANPASTACSRHRLQSNRRWLAVRPPAPPHSRPASDRRCLAAPPHTRPASDRRRRRRSLVRSP